MLRISLGLATYGKSVLRRWTYRPSSFSETPPSFVVTSLPKRSVSCHHCEKPTKLDWTRPENPENVRIRDLNDLFRRDGRGNGTVVVTSGVQGEGADFVLAAINAVRRFDAFSEDNDHWGEHDFGAVEIDGQRVFWKLDCYDLTLTYQSENPGNDALTHRVLTIMLAGEY